MQITSAMKMLSAAKLKKAQDAITAMRPYAAKLTELLQNLSGAQDNESPYTTVRPVKRILYVAISSNRGLCGGFNANIVKAVKAHAASNETDTAVFSVGKKGNDILSKDFDIEGHETTIFDDLAYANAASVFLVAKNNVAIRCKFYHDFLTMCIVAVFPKFSTVV